MNEKVHAALGMDAVLLSPSCADPLYRRSVRVSMGEVFAVPYAELDPWPASLDDVRAAIPMQRGVDSLNVAAAAAVAFWEVCR